MQRHEEYDFKGPQRCALHKVRCCICLRRSPSVRSHTSLHENPILASTTGHGFLADMSHGAQHEALVVLYPYTTRLERKYLHMRLMAA